MVQSQVRQHATQPVRLVHPSRVLQVLPEDLGVADEQPVLDEHEVGRAQLRVVNPAPRPVHSHEALRPLDPLERQHLAPEVSRQLIVRECH